MRQITVDDIEASARKLIGAPFLHQGRNYASGIDCIGTVIFVALDTGYISKRDLVGVDRTDYKRAPDAYESMVRLIARFADEVPLSEVSSGDILAFRMPSEELSSHVGIAIRGVREMMLVHALYGRTTVEVPLRQWFKFATKAYRMRGVKR